MGHDKLQPVSPAFARRIRWTVLFLLAFAVLMFGVASNRLLSVRAQRDVMERARLFAAALAPAANEGLGEAIATLVANSEGLVAAATIDAFGRFQEVYPDRLAHRELLRSSLEADAYPFRTRSPTTGEPCTVAVAVVKFGNGPSPSVDGVVVILKQTSSDAGWLGATVIFGLFFGAMSLLCIRSLQRWFELQIAQPLRRMAVEASRTRRRPKNTTGTAPPRLRETAQIAERFDELADSLADSDARTRRLAQRNRQELRDCEAGFDRKLRRAKDLAHTDALTRLRNRAFLDERIEPLFEGHRLRGDSLSAVMIDLDNFKQYNDAHGHQVGDALLRFVGALLRGSIRPTDHAIRYGGDEFLLLLPGANGKQATAIADRLVKMFGQYTSRLGRERFLSMSAGVASIPADDCQHGHELIAQADKALYAAKRGGKNTVACRESQKDSPGRRPASIVRSG